MKSKLLATAISALMIVAAGVATAAPGNGEMKAKLQALDTSGDGKISREEAAQSKGLAKHFDQIDANKDGFLTREEFAAQRARMAAAKLKAVDKDGDGRISRVEAEAKAPRLAKNFDQIDTNKDGYLSKEEITAAWKQAHGKR